VLPCFLDLREIVGCDTPEDYYFYLIFLLFSVVLSFVHLWKWLIALMDSLLFDLHFNLSSIKIIDQPQSLHIVKKRVFSKVVVNKGNREQL